VNLWGSVLVLPGSIKLRKGIKRVIIGWGALAVLCCAIWYGTRAGGGKVHVHEPALEIVAYGSYLCAVLSGFVWFLVTNKYL
jgi:hypothetical protein